MCDHVMCLLSLKLLLLRHRYLAESSSNVFACDREGNTCLHYAALYGHSTVISCLLDRCRERGVMHRQVKLKEGW